MYDVLTSKLLAIPKLLTLNEDSRFKFSSYYFLYMFFLRCPISPKAIHNNTGNFSHKCSEPLNVHQSNLAVLVFSAYFIILAVCCRLFCS